LEHRTWQAEESKRVSVTEHRTESETEPAEPEPGGGSEILQN
jgi:hypothetical protein